MIFPASLMSYSTAKTCKTFALFLAQGTVSLSVSPQRLHMLSLIYRNKRIFVL